VAEDESSHSILAAGTVTVAALVVLAGCLPGDAELGGDLWPRNAEFDGVVDQRREFGFCLHLRNAGAPDPFQDLQRGHPGNLVRQAE
jgi:hypothetical protein